MDRGRNVEGIHKNTRRKARPDQARGRKTTNEHTDLPNLGGGREKLVWQQECIHSILLEGVPAEGLIGQPNRQLFVGRRFESPPDVVDAGSERDISLRVVHHVHLRGHRRVVVEIVRGRDGLMRGWWCSLSLLI